MRNYQLRVFLRGGVLEATLPRFGGEKSAVLLNLAAQSLHCSMNLMVKCIPQIDENLNLCSGFLWNNEDVSLQLFVVSSRAVQCGVLWCSAVFNGFVEGRLACGAVQFAIQGIPYRIYYNICEGTMWAVLCCSVVYCTVLQCIVSNHILQQVSSMPQSTLD